MSRDVAVGGDLIDHAVAVEMVRRARLLERACELALQSGTCGVLVRLTGWLCRAAPDPSVPYGEIHFTSWL